LIALISLADRRGRLVGSAKLGLEAGWTNIDLGGDSLHVHVTDTASMYVYEALVPNDPYLMGQVLDLPSGICIRVVGDGDWRSQIDTKRQLWIDS
jgi:hypothetical protein